MGPLSWSAIAAGSAALAESLGLGAAATGLIVGNRNKNIEEFKEWAKTQYPMPEIKVNVPSAENALVLRPEYRTVTTPVEYIGYKPLFNSTEEIDEDSILQDDTTRQQSSAPPPKPKNDPKQDNKGDNKSESPTNDESQSAIKRGWNKKGLPKKVENPTLKQDWHRVGQNIAYGIGRSARFVSSPGFTLPVGIIGGATLGGYWATRDNNTDKANQIDTVATRKHNTHRFNVVEIAE